MTLSASSGVVSIVGGTPVAEVFSMHRSRIAVNRAYLYVADFFPNSRMAKTFSASVSAARSAFTTHSSSRRRERG